MKSKLNFLLAFSILFACTSLVFAADATKYHVTAHYAIPGDGGWDYLSLAPDGARLFITRATHVQVVDTASGKLLGGIPDTAGVHGVAVVHDLGLGVTSNGKANSLTFFDLATLKKTGEVKAGNKPDAIIYDPFSHHVFAFNGNSHDATVVDPAKAQAPAAGSAALPQAPAVIATIPLDGAPEFAATDLRGHIFANLEDKNEMVEIDAQNNTVLAHWPLTGCDGPTGLAIDRIHNRLFSVCSNQIMTVLDTVSGKLVATVPIGKRPDAAAFDAALGLAFSSNGDGTLTVVRQDSADKYSVTQTVPTAVGARTLALDPKSHKLYLVTAKFGPTPAPTAERPRPRPAMIPGTFEVLVVAEK